jgi:hypothetical protein
MTSEDEVRAKLAHPRILEHFDHEPNFAELLAALEEFGHPRFELYDRQSFCAVTIPGASGEILVCGQTETAANPSAAGLDCLLALLHRVDCEVERGFTELEAHLRQHS